MDGFDPGDRAVAEVPPGVATPPTAVRDAGLARLRAWSAVTTVWHPAGR